MIGKETFRSLNSWIILMKERRELVGQLYELNKKIKEAILALEGCPEWQVELLRIDEFATLEVDYADSDGFLRGRLLGVREQAPPLRLTWQESKGNGDLLRDNWDYNNDVRLWRNSL